MIKYEWRKGNMCKIFGVLVAACSSSRSIIQLIIAVDGYKIVKDPFSVMKGGSRLAHRLSMIAYIFVIFALSKC